MEAQDAFSFPILKLNVLIESLKGIDIMPLLTKEDIKEPSPMVVESVYRVFLALLMGVTEDQLGKTEFIGLDVMEHPQIHEGSIPVSNFISKMGRLMEVVGVPDFSLQSILKPKAKRFVYELSALINFVRFQTDQQKFAFKLEERTANLLEEKDSLALQLEQLKATRNSLRNDQEGTEAVRQEITGEIQEYTEQITDLGIKIDSIKQDVERRANDLKKSTEKQVADSFRLETIGKEITKLQSQVIEDPSELVHNVEMLRRSVADKKQDLSEHSKKAKAVSDELKQMKVGYSSLEAASKILRETSEAVEKKRLLTKDCDQLEIEYQTVVETFKAAEDSLETCKQETVKLYAMMNQKREEHEKTIERIRSGMLLAQEQRRSQKQEHADRERKMKELKQNIAMKERHLQQMQKSYELSTTLLIDRFAQLKRQVSEYQMGLRKSLAMSSI